MAWAFRPVRGTELNDLARARRSFSLSRYSGGGLGWGQRNASLRTAPTLTQVTHFILLLAGAWFLRRKDVSGIDCATKSPPNSLVRCVSEQ